MKEETREKAREIFRGLTADKGESAETPLGWACMAMAMLTSSIKAEREEAKQMIRRWKAGGPAADF